MVVEKPLTVYETTFPAICHMAKIVATVVLIAIGRAVTLTSTELAAISGSGATAGSSEVFSRGATASAKSKATRPLLAVVRVAVTEQERHHTCGN